jgi:D-alanyl-D-alanine dipeptidase
LDEPPPAPPARWVPLIGEYGSEASHFIVLERDGKLMLRSAGEDHALNEVRADSFVAVVGNANVPVVFTRDGARISAMRYGGAAFPSVPLGPESGNQLLVQPVRPLDELRREAMAMQPPVEAGPFRPSDLVELVKLDPTIHLEIRYATSNNLFGTPFYTQARAFMQRPAAEALVRANAALRQHGYGLLIHDGYRPWYVTKMFWEAAPVPKRIFVANPATGSRHNRGEAVDLSLYELATGRPVEMVSTYDETTDRAAADYPGGTSRQRWYRALLRRVMEAEHFTVNPTEWWHFDYADWKEYAIGNQAFEQISPQ